MQQKWLNSEWLLEMAIHVSANESTLTNVFVGFKKKKKNTWEISG